MTRPSTPAPGPAAEARAGLLVAVGSVLLGAPVGLLWALLAPELVVSASGELPGSAEAGRVLVQADGTFVLLAVLAGLLTAAVASALGRRHLLGTALGLVVGGALAAEVARRTGTLVGREEARELLAAAADGAAGVLVELPVRLRATSALAVWPLAALALHTVVLGTQALRDRSGGESGG